MTRNLKSRSLKGGYYLYKLLMFFILIVGSYLAINFTLWEYGNGSLSACESKGLQNVINSFLNPNRKVECSERNIGSIKREISEQGNTIWNPLAKSWLTEEQVILLKLAHDLGYKDGGAQHALLLQSTLMQESIAGSLNRVGHKSQSVGKRSYGVMQVKVSAARDVIQEYPELGKFHTDEELIVSLMTDDEFNIRIASKFLHYLRKKTDTAAHALMAYNLGLRGSKNVEDHAELQYVKNVNRYFEYVVKPFNRKYLGGSKEELLPV